ncbi:MAG: DNA-directed RNA polymerase subunit beta [Candidatus Abawacabacteria bacterium RIFCSPHIGHO2_01_FULL_46_8]|uniref:DNA-directed RNA polymerase subunit beta n=1 Tax=Candidatus Abawacabacteria bacterium RIFCSPHIGHO2_01_FULL_46_8 TaxID=1817815 RepID=A0A1F4XMN4_9BACT|nr:MAG: DNA-directed RNA polymerase subunit beta [Candidatus Abawacabacteria bacterium RIFCSPHIGHO2_01_FULL_46_8]
MATKTALGERKFFGRKQDHYPLPNLVELQLNSYQSFVEQGLKELFAEISPIEDFTGKNLELRFLKYSFDEPKYDEAACRDKGVNFEAPLKVQVQLINKVTGEVKEQEVFLGNVPMMTKRATFIINGVERVVVSQIMRSPGILFIKDNETGYFTMKISPDRGVWLEIETSKKGVLYVKIDRKRKLPVTALLRAFGYGTDKEIIELFKDVNADFEHDFILATLDKDTTSSTEEGLQAVYRRIRPGDLATTENVKSLINTMFFDFRKYDLGRVGRYKVNKKFSLNLPNNPKNRIFQVADLIVGLKELVRLNNEGGTGDDVDHLGNRRIRAVGELVKAKFRVGLLRTERIIKDRMTVLDLETVVPTQLINSRPISAAMREFFASSQLSQFMDQTNPLSELSHKRRISAMGPGGLTRERASFDVRDVHASHYGRICPIATPEGPNIGLVAHLATYAKVNDFGYIETPYRTVKQTCPNKVNDLLGRMFESEEKQLLHPKTKKVLVKNGDKIDRKLATELAKIKEYKEIPVRPYLTDEVNYYDADDEKGLVIAQANVKLDALGQFVDSRVEARKDNEAALVHVKELTNIDVEAKQIVSLSTALIPFLEHDEGTRALMGTNMQRQAVPLLVPDAPIVGTGMERIAAVSSGQAVTAESSGVVSSVDGTQVTIITEAGKRKTYPLINYVRSNQGTCLHQRPIVRRGDKVKKGDVIIDGTSTEGGELALGRNLLVAYMTWQGGNFEDAIIISENVLKQDYYSSIHIEEYTIDVSDTKLGPEIVTRDIPNVGDERLKDLDEQGIVRIGAEVKEGDILVGKITPKGETELTAEERLLRAIFGDKARDVKDTSLRLPGGQRGKVVGVRIYTRQQGDELLTGVNMQVKVLVAQVRQISIGDKLAGRHGNKGVISRIVPVADMPFLADGTPVEIILNPLGVISRMNIGQVLETHLGLAAKKLDYKAATPVLGGASFKDVEEQLVAAGLPKHGKLQLFDGRTGEPFDEPTTVGIAYMLKLSHMVDDKMHARSIGPYSLVTQQPLGGKAQHGGQRFGEMEVWALEAYGAAHTLQEMLTIKSDDVLGRAKAYESIIKNEAIRRPRTPEGFHVLVRELRSLGLDIELGTYDEETEDDLAEKEEKKKGKSGKLSREAHVVFKQEAPIVSTGAAAEGSHWLAEGESEEEI